MCGIFASLNVRLDERQKHKVRQALGFRGPDFHSGFIESSGWSFFHARLSIIDLSPASNQPFIDASGGVLVFNGEILNYEALGAAHFGRKYVSDTALLSDLIVSGKLSLSELDGFFAFVYVDSNGLLKYAARDKFGVKPLYFYEHDGAKIFSSEPGAIVACVGADVSQAAIEEYKVFRAPIISGSFFSGISQVAPGSCCITGDFFDLTGVMSKAIESRRPASTAELEEALVSGIRSRLVSDAPVGLLLSAGVDSNLIKCLSDGQLYYSIGFGGDPDYEYLYKRPEDGLSQLKVTPEMFREAFDYLLRLRGEPLSVPNEVLLFLIGKYASANHGVKVMLSGEGADEFFGGYDRIFRWAANSDHFDVREFASFYCYGSMQSDRILDSLNDIFASCDFSSVFEKVRFFFIKYHLPILFRRLDFSLMAAGVEGREPIANQHVLDVALKFRAEELMSESLGKVPLRALLSRFMGENFSFSGESWIPR